MKFICCLLLPHTKNGDYGFNKYSRAYCVPKTNIEKYTDDNTILNNVKALGRLQVICKDAKVFKYIHEFHLEEFFLFYNLESQKSILWCY